MDGVLDHLDAAEMGAVIVAQEFVVIAGQVDEAGALARLAQKLLHHVVVRLRPIPARAQLPAVDDIADQIDRLGIVIAQEVEQTFGLAAARAEMNIRNKESTEQTRAVLSVTMFDLSLLHCSTLGTRISASHCSKMTTKVNVRVTSTTNGG